LYISRSLSLELIVGTSTDLGFRANCNQLVVFAVWMGKCGEHNADLNADAGMKEELICASMPSVSWQGGERKHIYQECGATEKLT
ncbi:hypothetical protein, partial [Planktothrix sp. FACHB-1355]